MHGFYGRILKINLSDKICRIETIRDDILLRFPGGKGLASHLLYQLNPRHVNPFSPENHLIFTTGPVTGSLIWGSSRYGVFTKSPQTGLYSESYSGGKVPEAMDAAGFDAVVIYGKSRDPAVVVVHSEGADFQDAADIWGLETYDAEDQVNQRFGPDGTTGEKSGAVVIGPAGENRVRFAIIANDYWRSAGRTGVGTVMGSKKLKAILFHGKKRRPLYDPEGVVAFSKKLAKISKQDPGVHAFRTWGTPKMVQKTNQAKAFPTRYWSEGVFDKWENIGAKALHKACKVTPNACSKCFIACGRLSTIQNGRHAGLKIEGPEYETIFAFGGLCLIDDITEIAYLNDLCDRLGMDTISAGNICAFVIEASLQKKIDYTIDYGDADAIATLLKKIAFREGIGDILANGTRHAAKQLDLEDLAVHVKGLELPGYDPRVLKGSGLAFAVSDRGGCHLRASFHSPELRGVTAKMNLRDQVELLIDFEDRLVLMDTLILCRFFKSLYPWERLSEIIYLTCGIHMGQNELRLQTSAIASLVRRYNIREGLTSKDDKLPGRFYRENLRSGHGIRESDVNRMVKMYYRLRGWNSAGVPIG